MELGWNLGAVSCGNELEAETQIFILASLIDKSVFRRERQRQKGWGTWTNSHTSLSIISSPIK